MNQSIVAARVLAEEAERHLPLTQLQYAGIAALLFVLMLMVTLSFRSLWHRNAPSAYVPPENLRREGSHETPHGRGRGH